MRDSNTIKGRHFSFVDGSLVLDSKDYYWHIPKVLRDKNIKKGDVVLVKAKGRKTQVIVTDSFREDIEDTGKKYSCVEDKIDPSPEVVNAIGNMNFSESGT